MRHAIAALLATSTLALVLPITIGAQAAQVTKGTVAGVTNFARVETTVACAGAATPESMAEIKRMGFASVINLRLATETGANIDAEAAAAKVAGLRYAHVPLNGASPDPAAVDAFLDAIKDPNNNPAFIHCSGGNRAAAMWMVKRVQIDGWDIAKASDEATALGMTGATMKQFVLDYLQSHPRSGH